MYTATSDTRPRSSHNPPPPPPRRRSSSNSDLNVRTASVLMPRLHSLHRPSAKNTDGEYGTMNRSTCNSFLPINEGHVECRRSRYRALDKPPLAYKHGPLPCSPYDKDPSRCRHWSWGLSSFTGASSNGGPLTSCSFVPPTRYLSYLAPSADPLLLPQDFQRRASRSLTGVGGIPVGKFASILPMSPPSTASVTIGPTPPFYSCDRDVGSMKAQGSSNIAFPGSMGLTHRRAVVPHAYFIVLLALASDPSTAWALRIHTKYT